MLLTEEEVEILEELQDVLKQYIAFFSDEEDGAGSPELKRLRDQLQALYDDALTIIGKFSSLDDKWNKAF